ncbi:hypothetical protein MNB_SV-12-1961 [hydrothermal vent metagenome]|uniref:Uncharacterized protein n=1 Tax=hydrothermal vent metagenome TaxID=652676 RepID=A0A1W1CI39_9ZZZZ
MLNSIGFCLVLALLLVWAVAWFLSKRVRDRDQTKVKLLSNTIIEKENIVKDLESVCVERKNQLNRLIDEGIVCRHQLLQKSNFLRKKSDELYRVQEKLKDVKSQIVYIEKMEENKVLENLKEKSSQNKFSEEIKKMKNIIEKKNSYM